MSDEPEYSLNMQKVAEMLELDQDVAEEIHDKGVTCPKCSDYLQNLGEVIRHKHDFGVDDLKEAN